jgi:regulator of protease activity HflC (stomatin/prohibitin superfamily)
MSEAKLIEARAKAEVDRLEAQNRAEMQRIQSEANSESTRQAAEADAESRRIRTEAEIRDLQEREKAAGVYGQYPSLMRLLELETLRDVSKSNGARIYVNFDRDSDHNGDRNSLPGKLKDKDED